MDLVNIGRSRRFLRERPIRVNLFDRPRLVCDLICLETEQTEKRRGLATSDSLYVVVEGKARLVTGPQIEEVEEQDVALVPPGVDHTIENIGPGRLTVMALVTPKPTRAAEVKMPVQGRPRVRVADGERETRGREREERSPPRRGFEGPPKRDRSRGPRVTVTREPRGEPEEEGPVWFPRPKPAWRPRGRPPAGGGSGGKGRPGAQSGRGSQSRGRSGRSDDRGRSNPPAQRGGSRGRPPPRQNGRPAQGRNAPRTSGRRRSRES
jgi:hypothetical protein